MLIICNNREGETPYSAPVYSLQNTVVSSIHACVRYARWCGSSRLARGVYLQRYDKYYDPCRSEPFFIADRLQASDLVQESANADHPQDQSERSAT